MSKKKRSTKRKRKPQKGKSKLWPRLRLLAVVAIAGAAAWILWPFWQLSQQFGVFSVEAPTRVYARPRVLSTGQLLGRADLERELEEVGYRSAGQPWHHCSSLICLLLINRLSPTSPPKPSGSFTSSCTVGQRKWICSTTNPHSMESAACNSPIPYDRGRGSPE